MMRKYGILKYFYMLPFFLLAITLNTGSASAGTGFPDVPDSHWAANHIAMMSSAGIVAGFEDGTFRPSDPVTQVQAVLMALRCTGDKDVSFDLDRLPFTVPAWASEDVARAMKLQLLTGDDTFQAAAPAPRAWIARLLVRLVGKESQALSEKALPDFVDSGKIPSWAAGYIKVAQDNNLVGGYEDNSFRPDRTVTRAEMAALLGRAMEFTGMVPAAGDGGITASVVTGIVQSVYPEAGALVVESSAGDFRTLYLPQGANVSVPGSSGKGLDVIKTGDHVEISLNQDGYIGGIKVKSHAQDTSGEGTVYDLNASTRLVTLQDKDGKLHPYRLENYVDVYRDGYRFLTLDDVQVGDWVRLKIKAGTVQEIEILEASFRLDLTGQVVMVSQESRSAVLDVDGELQVLRVGIDAVIIVPGLNYTSLSDVAAGDEVTVRVENGEIARLEVKGTGTADRVAGLVVSVDAKNRTVTLRDDRGKLSVYEIKNSARLLVDGYESGLASIKKDMNAAARLAGGQIVFFDADNSITGTVRDIDKNGLRLVVRDFGGRDKTYIVDKNVNIDSEDGRYRWSEVRKGDDVKIGLDDGMVVTIKLRTQKVLRVEQVLDDRDRIEARDEDGSSVRLYMRDHVDLVVPGINYPGLEDVWERDTVRAVYMGYDLKSVEVLSSAGGSRW